MTKSEMALRHIKLLEEIEDLTTSLEKAENHISYLEGVLVGMGVTPVEEEHPDTIKDRNLRESSKKIAKYAKKHNLKIDKGSSDDN